MSSAHVTPGSVPGPKLAAHFASLEVQKHAARLGMWLFLATEILLFAGLFACYAAYRFLFPEAWAASSRSLDLTMGTINTVVLITSSFTAAMAVHYAKEGKNKMVGHMNVLTLLMAMGFLVIKFFEYKHKFHIGTLPGRYYFYEGIQLPGAPMYFSVYFASTALHALHVVIGMTVLAFATVRAYRVGDFSANNYTQVELGSMYWHLVDLVWIFLFPMLYLV
ncbi:cytochrome c oxidase subunit 3 family protein [Corallococcus sp. AB049A]|uniref:Cytochrome c oxidase subunit 3 family protein n=1 Tax=Corallococcus interemptor TaxID=2316720 RepID=A0A3A8PSQ5_9BACT|nr:MULTISPECIES: cytochrome c oxidase subunit 3 family protein [Corallococcus]RKH38353.1 cytochrome c oxidase subunit 3 family protein [Corallococcus sp. AB050B]RKH57911.1 cytochrome c oxidase subunit 3 family protein [Corallococcus interemptor]RKI51071.1 cytochrome c oxidase subunit 3 family protein [Corallococcus sp. AB049A]